MTTITYDICSAMQHLHLDFCRFLFSLIQRYGLNLWITNEILIFCMSLLPCGHLLYLSWGDNNIHAIVRAQYASKFKIRCSPVENYDLYSGQGVPLWKIMIFFQYNLLQIYKINLFFTNDYFCIVVIEFCCCLYCKRIFFGNLQSRKIQ